MATEIAVSPPVARWASRVRPDPGAVAAWTSAFAIVTYLALRDGGYDTIVRSQVGVIVWWLILLCALAGLLPRRIGAAGWIAVALLGGFTVWTGLAVGWTENQESTIVELGRLASYLGILVLAIALQGRNAARPTIAGLACAIGLVTVLAVLSRLHPQAFSAPDAAFLSAASLRRLSYPLNYWNGLAAFAAIGVPPLLAVALGARRRLTQALAAAVLPLSALCIYLTVSRGGVVECAVGLVLFLAVVPRRLEAVATTAVALAGAAILIAASSGRHALTSGVRTPLALHQGAQVLWLSVVVCAGVGLLQVAMSLSAAHLHRPAVLTPSRSGTARRGALLVVMALAVAIAVGVPGRLAHAWQDFKQPSGVIQPHSASTVFGRLSAANGNSRYQFWQAAIHAMQTRPFGGIGPGTFQFWWTRHATADILVRNAHSLYFETLAETGIIGLTLLGGLWLWFVTVGTRRLAGRRDGSRLWIAAALSGLGAFLVAAAVDWVWQLAAIAASALILGAVLVGGPGDPAPSPEVRTARRHLPRVGLVILALGGLAAVVVPFAGAVALRESRAQAAAGHLSAAYQDAVTAERIQPYAASPRLQQALILEDAGELGRAAAAARAATARGATDWTNWLTLARIEGRRGAAGAALAALRRAERLNPHSPLFTGQ